MVSGQRHFHDSIMFYEHVLDSSSGRAYCREASSSDQTGFSVSSTLMAIPNDSTEELVFNINKELNTECSYNRKQILIKILK